MNRTAVAISNELVIATIGLIGILVEVHVTDGSVYSGIFHAASMDGDYGIVLKKAKVAKKGSLLTNVEDDDTALDTLVIGSGSLVQIVAKIGVDDEIITSADIREERDDWNENDPNNDQDSSRWSDELRDSNLTGHSDDQSAFSQDVLENSGSMKPAAEEGQSIKTDEAVTVDSKSSVSVESESQLSDSTNLSASLSPKPANKKPHKLNPDARTFSPSVTYHRAVTPVPNYIPFTNYMAAVALPPANLQDEVEPSSFIHSPMPVKPVPPYTDTTDDAITNGGNDVQPTVDRAQSVRYPTGQYPNFPSVATYIYPNSQVAYGGGVMPVVVMPQHPVSSGLVQSSAPGFSPATTPRPPNQGHVLKYQELIAEEMVQHSSYYYAYSWYPQQ